MIITVTMNPAIDKTVNIDSLVYGGLNRIENILLDAGGKGINVSKTIQNLGGETIATGFLGGNNGRVMGELLDNLSITTDFVKISGETRINTKIVESDGKVTELNESGPVIGAEEWEELLGKLLQYAKKDTWFVLSGSVPSGIPKTIYRDIIQKVHEKGAKVFLDADGELFAYGVEAKPDVIKPNHVELEKYVGRTGLSDEELREIGQEFLKSGIKTVIISLGEKGALFLNENQEIKCPSIPVKVQSTVGAGDAMVAAFVYGKSKGQTLEECAKLAIATSAGAVATAGTKSPTLECIEELKKMVCLE